MIGSLFLCVAVWAKVASSSLCAFDIVENETAVRTESNGETKTITIDRVRWRNPDGTAKTKLYVGIGKGGAEPDATLQADLAAAMSCWSMADGMGMGWELCPVDAMHPRADVVIRVQGTIKNKAGKKLLGLTSFATKQGKSGDDKRADVIDYAVIDVDNDGNPPDDGTGVGGWEKAGDTQAQKDMKWNREAILKHELGHVLGIDHTKKPVMGERDIMWDGGSKWPDGTDLWQPDNDAPNLSPHDVKEAKAAENVHALAPVKTMPRYVPSGVPQQVLIAAGQGTDLMLDLATSVQITPVDPTRLQTNFIAVMDPVILAQVFVTPGTGTHQAFTIAIGYPFGPRTYAGVVASGSGPAGGSEPHAAFHGPPIETSPCFVRMDLDGGLSTHDTPGQFLTARWNVDGERMSADSFFFDVPLGRGIHTAKLIVRDPYAKQSIAEKTILVGRERKRIARTGRGGEYSDLLVHEGAEFPRASVWSASHGDAATGEVWFSHSNGYAVHSELVATAGAGRAFTSLAQDPTTGLLCVAYYDPALPGLALATRAAPGDWTSEIVPDSNGDDDGDYCRLAIDDTGVVHLAFLDVDLGAIRYAKRDTSGWTVETVAPYSAGAPWVSLEVNGRGQACIAWTDQSEVHFARRAELGWRVETVAYDAATDDRATCDLALDPDGDAMVVYVDDANHPAIARFDGTIWTAESVTSVTIDPMVLSACVDDSGDVHVAYYAPGAPDRVLKLLTRRGGDWTEIVLDPDTGTTAMAGASIRLSPDNTPCVSYLARNVQTSALELRVACLEYDCTGPIQPAPR